MGAVSGVYLVRRKFKSGNREFKPGEEWEPAGGKFDKKIISCGYVRFEPLHEDKTRGATRKKVVKDAS